MYLLYEHHKGQDGQLLATDMLMSSFFPGTPRINFKVPTEAGTFEFTKKTFKEVHSSNRNYDPKTNIWSFFGGVGASIYKILKESPFAAFGLTFERVDGLSEQVIAGYVKRPEKFLFDPSDFFYTPEAPKPSGPTKEQAETELKKLIGPVLDRKAYLRACLSLHPDRPENKGDASLMTNLNYYWQIYNS